MEIGQALEHAYEATNWAIRLADASEGAAAFVGRRVPRFARISS